MSPGRGALLATLLLGWPRSSHVQNSDPPLANWQHSVWTEASGPPVPGAWYLSRSPDGYLWLSAENCLLRFDGVRFTVFDSTTTPELRSKELGEFIPSFLDRGGRLWISGPGGERITYRDGRFHYEFTVPPGSGPFGEDDRGLVWLIDGKPHRVDEHGRPSPIPMPAAVPLADVWGVRPDTGGGFWIGTRKNGLWHVPRSGAARQYGTGEIRLLIQSRDGTIWAVGQGVNGTARLEGDRWIQLRLPGDSSVMFGRFAMEDAEGTIWFQTNAQGVLRYRNGRVEAFTSREGLSDSRVREVYPDPTGVVWVSTDAGLDRLRPAAFSAVDPGHVVAGSLGSTVYPDVSGAMWATDRESNTVVLLEGGILQPGAGPLTARRFRFAGRDLASPLAPSHRGGIWVKVFSGSLQLLQPDGRRQAFGDADGLAKARINAGIETRDGTLWMEINQGFGRLHAGRYRPVTIGEESKVSANAYAEDGSGRLWLAWGDQPNIAVFAGDSVVMTVKVPTEHVDYLALEHGDTLWAASEFGVVRIIGENAVGVDIPGLQRVLAQNPAIAVAQGSLWLSSAGGIARVPLAELHRRADGDSVPIVPQVFDALDGLETPRAARVGWQSAFTAPDGRVYVTTAAGLAVANPAPPRAPAPGFRTLIEEMTLDGTRWGEDTPLHAKPGRVDIHFTVTGMELPERARIEYRLDGSDRDWVKASLPRVASYNHLPPGRYVFRVRAWNENGVPSAAEVTRSLRVLPAWYQTLWFKAATVLLIGGIGAGVTVLVQRGRHLRAQRALRAQYEATLTERARIAQDLHDTLLQGFAGVTLQLKAAELALPEQPDVAVETIDRVRQLAQASLREARERVWDMRETGLDGDDLAVALEAFARERATGTGIEVSVVATGQRRQMPRTIEDAAFRIAREAVTNAVRHAGAGRIDIALEFGESLFRLEVQDDGRGFTPEQSDDARRRGHLGLTGIRDRAAHAGGRCEVRPRPEGGTLVALELPLDSAGTASAY